MDSDATIVDEQEPTAPEAAPTQIMPVRPGRVQGAVAAKRSVARGRWLLPGLVVVLLALVAYWYPTGTEQPLRQPEPRPTSVTPLFRAEEAWRTGQLVDAITIVKRLSSAPGGQLAAARLSHYSRVVEVYDKLTAMPPGPEYARHLTLFYLGLDPVDDQFFWQNLERDYQRIATPKYTELAQQFLWEMQNQYPDEVSSSLPDALNDTGQGGTACAKRLPGNLC